MVTLEEKAIRRKVRKAELKQEILAEIKTLEETAKSVGFTEKASKRINKLYKDLEELK